MSHSINYLSYGVITGYANAAKSYISALLSNDLNIAWETVSLGELPVKSIDQMFLQSLSPSEKKLLENEPKLFPQLMHLVPEHFSLFRRPEVPSTGMTVWETDQVPKEWINHLQVPDKLIVPCEWNKKVFREGGIKKKIHVVPHISEFEGDTDVLSSPPFDISPDQFVLLNVSVWERRKNIKVLIKSYLDAFPDQEDVVLILKTTQKNISQNYGFWRFKYYPSSLQTYKWLRYMHKNKKAQILLIDEDISMDKMKWLYFRANAFVSTTHAEGWGMGAYEAAWYGKPVIIPRYGGPLDFLQDEYTYFIDYKLGPVVKNCWDYKDMRGHQYAYPDAEHCTELMKEVYQNYQTAKDKAELNKKWLEENMSKTKITEKLLHALNE